MLTEVGTAVWIGALVAVVLKLLSPHRSWASWIFAAFVGGFGALVGLFGSRVLGVDREDSVRTLMIAGAFAAKSTVVYAAISRALLRRRTSGRRTRPTIAF